MSSLRFPFPYQGHINRFLCPHPVGRHLIRLNITQKSFFLMALRRDLAPAQSVGCYGTELGPH